MLAVIRVSVQSLEIHDRGAGVDALSAIPTRFNYKPSANWLEKWLSRYAASHIS